MRMGLISADNMIDINEEIRNLVEFAILKGLIEIRDRTYGINRLLDALELDSYNEPKDKFKGNLEVGDILGNIRLWAVENDRVEDDSNDLLDLYDTKIISQLIKMPSQIEDEFWKNYRISPQKATDYYYNLAKNSNYIRQKRIAKDIKWKYKTEYGILDITINLSKPEKDPRAIARAKELKFSNYPMCLLCKENEGYAGRLNHPARGNHRVIGVRLAGEQWYLQYSPYVYYNEHSIVFKETHEPMKITKMTFRRLLEFVSIFPHYFIGSNADLPIVGGSILSHDHFQSGNYTFPMAEAKEENKIDLKNGIKACTIQWPMSAIRLKGKSIEELTDTAYDIFLRWKDYDDEKVDILSHSNGEEHNTITPICRFRDEFYELDLVLRNNRTTGDRPYGIFHPREEYHHIKKENIGLIEVMGLAVLPSRLKTEMELLKTYLLNDDIEGIKNNIDLNKHYTWVLSILDKHKISEENLDEILNKEIGEVFLNVLKDAGVFKETNIGKKAFNKCRLALLAN